MTETNYKDIWDTLSSVDVSDHIEKKGRLSYLSWAWAWGTLMEHYPEAEFTFTEYTGWDGESVLPGLDVMRYPDGSCAVECTIKIGECKRKMWLPVMDYKNNSIENPSSRQISDAKMRCLTKGLALFGLGHYIYAGEDTPKESKESPEVSDTEIVVEEEIETPQPNDANDANDASDEGNILHAYEVFSEDQKTMKDLREWWKKNRDELKKIEEDNPEVYKKILNVFSERKRVLLKEEEEGNGN